MSANQNCPLCAATTNTVLFNKILWQDDFCRVVLLNDIDYPTYCRVELLAHIKEMSDLVPPQRARMMKVVFAVETALREMFNPDKINLASLGNKTPHIHWHVIPRFENDKHFPNSHWGQVMRGVKHDVKQTELDEKTVLALTQKLSALVECALASA